MEKLSSLSYMNESLQRPIQQSMKINKSRVCKWTKKKLYFETCSTLSLKTYSDLQSQLPFYATKSSTKHIYKKNPLLKLENSMHSSKTYRI